MCAVGDYRGLAALGHMLLRKLAGLLGLLSAKVGRSRWGGAFFFFFHFFRDRAAWEGRA